MVVEVDLEVDECAKFNYLIPGSFKSVASNIPITRLNGENAVLRLGVVGAEHHFRHVAHELAPLRLGVVESEGFTRIDCGARTDHFFDRGSNLVKLFFQCDRRGGGTFVVGPPDIEHLDALVVADPEGAQLFLLFHGLRCDTRECRLAPIDFLVDIAKALLRGCLLLSELRGILRVLLVERRDSGFLLLARLLDEGAHSRNLAATCPLNEARQLGDGALRVVVLLFPNRESLL